MPTAKHLAAHLAAVPASCAPSSATREGRQHGTQPVWGGNRSLTPHRGEMQHFCGTIFVGTAVQGALTHLRQRLWHRRRHPHLSAEEFC